MSTPTAATTCAREPLSCGLCGGCGRIVGCSHCNSTGIVPDLETRALGMLTDDQAMASFIRWRTAMHGAKAIASLRTALGVEACVDAIYSKAQ